MHIFAFYVIICQWFRYRWCRAAS